MKKIIALLLSFCFFCASYADYPLETHIEKSLDGTWTVNYKVDRPISRLAFRRNPDNSRITRWHAISEAIKIIQDKNSSEEAEEFIVRKDGKKFTQASFTLTPSYIHLPKDYGLIRGSK